MEKGQALGAKAVQGSTGPYENIQIWNGERSDGKKEKKKARHGRKKGRGRTSRKSSNEKMFGKVVEGSLRP